MKNEFGFAFDLDVKAITAEGEFTGYAAIFNNEDLGREVILPNAFTKSLQRRPAGKVKMLRQHDSDEPIGIWLDLAEDNKGLRAKGKLILDTVKGRETHALMRAGALDGLSIGFRMGGREVVIGVRVDLIVVALPWPWGAGPAQAARRAGQALWRSVA